MSVRFRIVLWHEKGVRFGGFGKWSLYLLERCGGQTVVHGRDVLVYDGTLVQLRCHVVSSGSNDLYAGSVHLLVRPRALSLDQSGAPRGVV